MANITVDTDRDVIPRWRDFKTTAALGELDESAENKGALISTSPLLFTGLESKILAWNTRRGIGEAADLLNNAYLLRAFDPSVVDAAKYLQSNAEQLSPALRRIADEILSNRKPQEANFDLHTLTENAQHAKIHKIRRYLVDQPRNSILYVELARMYTLLNQNEHAKTAMLTAVKLSPNNRFILRSASRLFLHIKETGLAHDVLRHAEKTKHDSWLLAAEISVASAVGHRARFLKNGERLIKSGSIEPKQITELATAVAMEEIEHGKNSIARKLIRVALVEPTENTLAQVAWAGRNKISLDDVDPTEHQNIPFVHESKAWQSFQDEDWENVRSESLLWYWDQPFSSRPINLAGYVASTLQLDYAESARIFEIGRKTNAKSFVILNNLAFAYASGNKTDEAEEVLQSVDHSKLTDENKIYLTATRGLIAFRRNQLELGRKLYDMAINDARERKDRKLALRAGVYYAREEIRLRPDEGRSLRQEILQLVNELKDRELSLIAEHQLSEKSTSPSKSSKR